MKTKTFLKLIIAACSAFALTHAYVLAQDEDDEYSIQDAIDDANEQADKYNFTKNQRNLSLAITKGTYKLFENVQYDDEGNLLNPTAKQSDYESVAEQLREVLYPELEEDREYSDSELEALDAEAAKKTKVFLNQLSPGLYTTLPTILFNSANMQNTQIQQRLWTMRMRKGQPELNTAGVSTANDGKTAMVENKKVVLPQEDPEQKWVAFVDGNGMWSQAQTVNNLPSYKTYGGGVQIGASREIIDGLVVGPYVGYQGTKVDFTGNYGGGSSATHNSVRFGLFAEYQLGGWYNDLIVGGAYNSIDVNHGIDISGYGNSFRRMAKGTVSGGEFDLLYGTGYEFKAGNFTFGPATSFQYTYVNLGGTQETGAGVLNQKIGGQSTSSLLYTLGGQVSYDINLTDSFRLQPMASLAWQHEFLQNGYDLKSSILGENYTYSTTNAGRDQFIAGVGFNLVFGKNLSAFAICNLINSDAKIFSQAVSGGINIKF